jgi:hypothetical protein
VLLVSVPLATLAAHRSPCSLPGPDNLPAVPPCIGCYRAAQIGVADKRTQEGTMILLDLLDALEKV